jgi:hypothetical protein
MTLTEVVKFMPGTQRLSIKVMGIELFSGSKGSLMHTSDSEDWVNDTVINMQSNSADTIIIELKDSVYTRDYICGRFIEASPILSEYRKLYGYNKGNGPLIKYVKQLLAEIRQDEDIL